MSDPWSEFRVAAPSAPSAQPSPPTDAWGDFRPPAAAPVWSGGVLPISESPDGKLSFDSNAGIIGSMKRAFTTPGDVVSGKIDLNNEEGLGRALEMAAMLSPVPPGIRAGKLGTAPPNVAPPTAQALKEAAGQGYTAVRNMGVDYAPSAIREVMGGLRATLEKDGLLAELAPNTHSIIKQLSNPPEGAVLGIGGLEAARRAAGFAAKDFTKPAEQVAASRLIQGIDDFIARADPNSVVAGPATAAGETLVKARANSAAGKRSDTLTGIEERADLQAAATNSGRNLDNTIRQRLVGVVTDPKKSRGFNADEIAALEGVVNGSPVRNGLRTVSNMIGGGGGLGALIAGGGAGAMTGSVAGAGIGTAIGATVPVVGMIAKALQNSMGRRALSEVDSATRARSPLHMEAIAKALMQPKDMAGSQAIMAGGAASALNSATPTDAARKALVEALIRNVQEGGA